jgi:hypothetical protein
MLILFDHVTPKGISHALVGQTVTRAKDRGDTLSNGDLLAAAEAAGFDVVITADKNMRYQQNLDGPPHRPRRPRHAAMALLFGKALSDLFGILTEIEDRMNNNPI